MATKIQIHSIEPTIFFIREGKDLRQLVRLGLENAGADAQATLVVRKEDWQERIPLEMVPAGLSSQEVYLREIERSERVSFSLWAEGALQSERMVDWQPAKKWEVHLVHYSHHDLGYTDIPSNVINEHVGFLDEVLRFCEETEDWPEEARFRWLIEQGYSLVEFADRRPKESVDRLMYFVKNGQVEVTALFGNQTMELSSHEELVRLLYPAFRFKREYGIDIVSATHNDIPGFSWGLASVLAAAGVKYFCPGVPSWYFGTGEDRVHPLWSEEEVLPLSKPGAFWWEGPDGAKVLLWYNLHGQEWHPTSYLHALRELPGMLQRLDEQEYPYDRVMYSIRGGHRDNAPPTLREAYIVREWNERWAYPRLISSTHRRFLEGFERKYGATLRTLRGDVPGTDYPAAASCTPKETAMNRGTHDLLMAGEKLATLASILTDYPYPKAALERAYRDVFYYDEHCWGMHQSGGPAMDGDWAEKSTYAYRGAALAHDILLKAGNKIVDEITYPEDGCYLTVFNSLAWKRSDIVHAPAHAWVACGNPMHWLAPRQADEGAIMVSGAAIGRGIINPPKELLENPFELIDLSTGASVPYQINRLSDPQAAQPYAAERVGMGKIDPSYLMEIVFLAEDLPSLGYKTYRLVPCKQWPQFPPGASVNAGVIENSFYRLEYRPQDGEITRLVDKALGRQMLDVDAPHGLGQMVVRSPETGQQALVVFNEVTILENGPIYTTLRRKGSVLGCPQWTQEIVLYHPLKRVELNTRLLRDSTPMLEGYFAFPFQVGKPQFRLELTNAVLEPIRDQLPGSNTDYYAVQHWAEVFNRDWGITWTPVDTAMTEVGGLWPGYVSGAHHGVTPPGYGHAFLKPGELTRGYIYALAMYNNFCTNFINVHPGETLFRYTFSSHPGDWQEASAWRFGWNALQAPFPVWMKGARKGSLELETSFCGVDAANLILLTIKLAEDGNGYILRLVEVQGKASEATITLPAVPVLHAYLTSAVEENLKLLPSTEHAVKVTVKPFSVITVRVIPQK